MDLFKVGSKLLNIQNAKDDDYVILTSETTGRKYEDHKDIFVENINEFQEYLSFKKDFNIKTVRKYSILYQYDNNIIQQNFPLKHSVLDQRDNYLRFIKYIIDNRLLNCDFNVQRHMNHGTYLSKNIYHLFYILFIIQNNATELTEDQQSLIQSIHDKKEPIERLNDLIALYNTLV